MKIFYITPARIPTEKAHGFQITKMCESFAVQSNEVGLIVPWRRNLKLENRDPYEYYDLKNNFRIRKVWLPDVLAANRFFPVLVQYLLLVAYTLAFAFISLFICLRSKPALVVTRDSRTAFLLSYFMPVVYESHQFSRSKLERFFERSAFKRCRCFITITRQLKHLYEEEGCLENKLFVLPDGVDGSKFDVPITREEARRKMGLPVQGKIVGYMGNFQTLEMEKGLIELIRCLKYVDNEGVRVNEDIEEKGVEDSTGANHKGVRVNERANEDNAKGVRVVMIGGPMSHVPAYLKVIEDEGLDRNQYIFMDRISFQDVPVALKAFDCCVMPFPWTEHYAYYMSPLKMFEYMACGRPIITTDLPSVREILNDQSALFVPPSDEKSLGEAIQRALADEELSTALAGNALLQSRDYGWENRAKKFLEAFQSMNK